MTPYLRPSYDSVQSSGTSHFAARNVFYPNLLSKTQSSLHFKFLSHDTELRRRFQAILAWSITCHFEFKYKWFFYSFFMKMFSRSFSICMYHLQSKQKSSWCKKLKKYHIDSIIFHSQKLVDFNKNFFLKLGKWHWGIWFHILIERTRMHIFT